jgi:uncharacterized membrane protein SpoIIM required for sporulation
VDIDVFVASHARMWARLEELVKRGRRPRRLSGAELDELVDLYQRTATDLSVVRSSSPDPMLVDRLSSLVARARSVVAGAHSPSWRDFARFVTVTFPAAVYRVRWWSIASAALFIGVATALAAWIVHNPEVQASIAAPEEIKQLVEHDFEDYYHSAPGASLAARYWTNNAWVSAGAVALGPLLGLPTLYILVQNALNGGVAGGLMIAHGRGGVFFGLILPHGLIELTAVFIACGAGMKIGWTVIDPGPRTRADAVAHEARAMVSVALGLVMVLAVAGAIEAFVTPSDLPTAARVAIGVVVEVGFLAAMFLLGRRAARAGETGDLAEALRGDTAPVA